MTPHDVLTEFETSRTVPVAAIRTALDAKEEMLPAFLAEIERALHTPWEELPHADSYGIIFYILGEWGDARAYLPLARFLRLDQDTLDALLDDTLTEASDRVMASVATDDLRPIFDILLDSNAYLFVRTGMLSALLRIAIEHPERRADTFGNLRRTSPRRSSSRPFGMNPTSPSIPTVTSAGTTPAPVAPGKNTRSAA
jgi:hypothetical protein